MNQRRIELHIDELVLQGFAAVDRHRIGEAVKQELVRLLRENDGAYRVRHGGDRDRVAGGTVGLEPTKPPEAAGVQIARAVYGGLIQRPGNERA